MCPVCASHGAEPAQSGMFQSRVLPWLIECFGQEIANDQTERNHRFVEEALELAQSCGCSANQAHQLVGYVYSRPTGQKGQEVGGVMVTLAALCLSHGLDMHDCGETELARIWTKVETIRAKQAAKPKHSPLPEQPEPSASAETPLCDAEFAQNAGTQALIDMRIHGAVRLDFARDLEQKLRASEASLKGTDKSCVRYKAQWESARTERDAAQAELTRLKDEMRVMRKLIFHILHQRTGPMGLKVEDDLIRENEPLYRKALDSALQP